MIYSIKKRGFSLIELLVVIAILALLLAIVIPALSKSREMTRRVVCASNQKQIALATVAYGEGNNGWLANFSTSAGPNVHDIDKRYVAMMEQQYGVKRTFFYCPSMPKEAVQGREDYNNIDTNPIFILGYSFWVPRYVKTYQMDIPPQQNTSVFAVIDSTEYWGPKKITDPLARRNPILTDEVCSEIIPQPILDIAAYNSQIEKSSCHQWRNRLEMINQAFSDGHVEKKEVKDIRVRYGYVVSPDFRWILR
jgi:prepilin-type N-terminal cleavage/methylation domain-containing protein